MRVRLKVQGGLAYFPGLAKPVELDLASLPAPEGHSIEQLIHDCRFFERPQPNVSPGSVPDGRTYEITVEAGERTRTLVIQDPVSDSDLGALIEKLQRYRYGQH